MQHEGPRQKTIPAFKVSEELHAAISQLAERNTRTITLEVIDLIKTGLKNDIDFESRLAAVEALVHNREKKKIRSSS